MALFESVSPSDVADLTAFLRDADLTLSALDSPEVRLWVERGLNSSIMASTGFELSRDGAHALLRSVAVAPGSRGTGVGLRSARFALARAAEVGAGRAWLFSRRSGPFWQRLGFEAAATEDLAAVLPDAHQVRHFLESGQLAREQAWSRPLPGDPRR